MTILPRKNQILIVENDRHLADLYQDLLADLGDIHICFSGNEAKVILALREFDIILTDYQMENGDGIELAKFVNDENLISPIVLLTGFATKEIAIQSVELGLYAFLEKKCDPDEIYKAVMSGIEFGKTKRRHLNFSSMGEISSILMHEIVDPLNRSLSRIELIESHAAEGSKDLENFKELREDLEYISRLITNVRLQIRGSKEVYLKKFPLQQFIEVIETLQPDLKVKIINHSNKWKNLAIRSDVVLFNQVLENLRKNTLEALAENQPAVMELLVSFDGENIIWEFINNTPEIPVEMRTKIFEAFVSTKKDSNSNFGIGLYFCSQILKNHGGEIWVKETLPTTFVMKIPKA